MVYRYFECTKCPNKFNQFVEDADQNTCPCPVCGAEAKKQWNDPNASGTKLYFDYMER